MALVGERSGIGKYSSSNTRVEPETKKVDRLSLFYYAQ